MRLGAAVYEEKEWGGREWTSEGGKRHADSELYDEWVSSDDDARWMFLGA